MTVNCCTSQALLNRDNLWALGIEQHFPATPQPWVLGVHLAPWSFTDQDDPCHFEAAGGWLFVCFEFLAPAVEWQKTTGHIRLVGSQDFQSQPHSSSTVEPGLFEITSLSRTVVFRGGGLMQRAQGTLPQQRMEVPIHNNAEKQKDTGQPASSP